MKQGARDAKRDGKTKNEEQKKQGARFFARPMLSCFMRLLRI
jgi:hypothetical protein